MEDDLSNYRYIKNREALATSKLRADAIEIIEAGLSAVNSKQVMREQVVRVGNILSTGKKHFDLKRFKRVFVIALGKCAVDSAFVLEELLGDVITDGIVLDVREGKFKTLRSYVGTHPFPSEANSIATTAIKEMIENVSSSDLVLTVISGGCSTLLNAPYRIDITLQQELVRALWREGATIEEVNTVRKHTSIMTGGQLAKRLYPATVISLIFSDVPGNNLETIGSGPTILDSSTIDDAEGILRKYRIRGFPKLRSVELVETPKEHKYFKEVTNILVVSNNKALSAMKGKAQSLGYVSSIESNRVQGNARDIGEMLASKPMTENSCLLYGGESTVKIVGGGVGGRNQELALSASSMVDANRVVVAVSSDGWDNTANAGAIADAGDLERAKKHGLSIKDFLDRNDSYNFWKTCGGGIEMGKTGINVADFYFVLTGSESSEISMDTLDKSTQSILWFDQVNNDDVQFVGGKNASLGEMYVALRGRGVLVPNGFVITAKAYRDFISETGLMEVIKKELTGLDTSNIKALQRAGKAVRSAIVKKEFTPALAQAIREAYFTLSEFYNMKNADVAVRSSATAEDLPGASFAGEHETYLNVEGEDEVLLKVREAMASLFTDRAISYRVDKGFDHFSIALSVGVQKMVRSDIGSSGVMFTLDTETGFRDVVVINASWGLGEMVVQGKVTPDEFMVFKPTLKDSFRPIVKKTLGEKKQMMVYTKGSVKSNTDIIEVNTPRDDQRRYSLTDDEVLTLARWGMIIEEHYTRRFGKPTPMDIEWARDGKDNQLYIVQARPETVQSEKKGLSITEYILGAHGDPLTEGITIGQKIVTGNARIILQTKNLGEFKDGEILITEITDPDWEPIMKKAKAIITAKGGRTSHAAIVSRELGIPAVIGIGMEELEKFKTGMPITVDCSSGSVGYIYPGTLTWEERVEDLASLPEVRTKVSMNIGSPDSAFAYAHIPHHGVGLAREEFIIASGIGIHPNALLEYDALSKKLRTQIDAKTLGYDDKVEYYVSKLAEGIAQIGSASFPEQVIVRFSDFKTNEYRTLVGGDRYEPHEENPMLGWRGASRYYNPKFKAAFGLECRAIKRVREEFGLHNVHVMIPFCRTPDEGRKVLETMSEFGLSKGSGGLCVYVMCEIPANVIRREEFLDVFDGFSIGSNDLTQLVVGLDRDSALVAGISNENDVAVRMMITDAIRSCKARGKYIGICGQAPSDFKDFLEFLIREGIDSVSLNPDSIVPMLFTIAEVEKSIQERK